MFAMITVILEKMRNHAARISKIQSTVILILAESSRLPTKNVGLLRMTMMLYCLFRISLLGVFEMASGRMAFAIVASKKVKNLNSDVGSALFNVYTLQ